MPHWCHCIQKQKTGWARISEGFEPRTSRTVFTEAAGVPGAVLDFRLGVYVSVLALLPVVALPYALEKAIEISCFM
jgi:hypothetical protein